MVLMWFTSERKPSITCADFEDGGHHGCGGQNRFWDHILGGLGEFTTHFRTYFSGDWDVKTGGTIWILTHGHMALCGFQGKVAIPALETAAFCDTPDLTRLSVAMGKKNRVGDLKGKRTKKKQTRARNPLDIGRAKTGFPRLFYHSGDLGSTCDPAKEWLTAYSLCAALLPCPQLGGNCRCPEVEHVA